MKKKKPIALNIEYPKETFTEVKFKGSSSISEPINFNIPMGETFVITHSARQQFNLYFKWIHSHGRKHEVFDSMIFDSYTEGSFDGKIKG